MHRASLLALVAAPLALAAFGCSGDEEPTEAKRPPMPLDQGKVEPKLVGDWAMPGGGTTLAYAKDGTFTIKTDMQVMAGQGGMQHIKGQSKGKWAVLDDRLMMRQDDGLETDYKWSFDKDGKTLLLKSKNAPKATGYTRIKK